MHAQAIGEGITRNHRRGITKKKSEEDITRKKNITKKKKKT
jgi:hypothetical protein